MNYGYRGTEKILEEIFTLRDTNPAEAQRRINELQMSEKYSSDICFRVFVHCLKSNLLYSKKEYRLALDEAFFALSIEIPEDENWLKAFCYNILGDLYAVYRLLNLSNDMYLNAASQGEVSHNCDFSALFFYKIGRNYTRFDDFLMAEAYFIRALQSLDTLCSCVFTVNLESLIIGHLILTLTATNNRAKLPYYIEKMELIAADDMKYKSLLYHDKLAYYASFNDLNIHEVYTTGCGWFRSIGDDEAYLEYSFSYYKYLYEQKHDLQLIIKGISACLELFNEECAHLLPSYINLLKIQIQCQLRSGNKSEAIKNARKYADIWKKRNAILNAQSNEILGVLKSNFLTRHERLLLQRKNEEINNNAKCLNDASNRLALLNDIGERIISNCDFNIIATYIKNYLKQCIEIDAVMIGMLDIDHKKLDILANKEFEDYLDLSPILLDEASGYIKQCVETKQIIYINNFDVKAKEEHVLDYQFSKRSFLTQLYCPIMYDDKVIGIYTLKSLRASAYDFANFALIKELAIFLAIAIANIERKNRLNVELEEKSKLASQLQLAKEQFEQLKNHAELTNNVIKEKGALDE